MKRSVIYFSIGLTILISIMVVFTTSTAQAPQPATRPEVDLGEPGLSYRYVQSYGETDVPYFADPDYLNDPIGIYVDGNDNLYVTEEMGFRVLEFDPSATISLTLGIAGHPAWMFGGDGNLFNSPHDVALDDSGNIWVTDENRVAAFDSNGGFQQQLVDSGDPIPFNGLWGIDFDSEGRMFVADPINHRVQVYDLTSGTPVYSTTLGIPGDCEADDTHFCYPWRIALDSLDQLYVADANNGRVQKCTYSSGWSCSLFDSGLSYPHGLTVDGSDHVYIADTFNSRIRKCVSGICSDFATGTPWFMDLAVDSAGNVYGVADGSVYSVYKYDNTGVLVDPEYIGHAGAPYPTDFTHFYLPLVGSDAEDNILITEEWGHRLIKLDPDGNYLWSFGEAGVSGWDDEHLNSPMRVGADGSGNIYVPDRWACRVQIISPEGDYIATIGGPNFCGSGDLQFISPTGVAIDSNSLLYVADKDNHRVQILDISTPITPTLVATIGETGVCGTDNDHLCYPSSVALDTAGNLYIADSDNHRVQKFDGDLEHLMTIGTGIPGRPFDQLDYPESVAVDAQGRIFVSDLGNLRVQVFDSTGAYLTTIGGASGTNSAQFNNVSSVAVDNAGNVYVSDNRNSRIQKFAPGVPDWLQVNINGFGSPSAVVVSLEIFNGQLYAGTGDWEYGTQLWRTSDGNTWEPVTQSGSGIGEGNFAILDMIEFDGKLYVGTGWNPNANAELWRTTSGEDWEPVLTFGADTASIDSLGVFGNQIYAAVSELGGVVIYRSSTGDVGSWFPVVTQGNGNMNNTFIDDFVLFNNRLYAVGNNEVDGAFVWQSSADGNTWIQVNTPGFDDSKQLEAMSAATFNGNLFVGTCAVKPCYDGIGQIWISSVGTDWSPLVTDGFGNNNNGDISALVVHKEALFAVVQNETTGAQVWRTFDGTNWVQVTLDGWGNSNNQWTLRNHANQAFEDKLIIGSWNGNGTEIWRYEPEVTAGFTATPTIGIAPLEVHFTNTSTGTLTASLWDFGDGITSTLTSPAHIYESPGTYTVSLTADSFGNTDTVTQTNFITVYPLKLYLPVIRR